MELLGNNFRQIVENDFKEAQEKFQGLKLELGQDVAYILGSLEFSATYDGYTLEDVYTIKMMVPSDYPENIPRAWELDNRIPDDFHKYDDLSLCLGAPLEVIKKIDQKNNLCGFIELLLIPYLYSYSFLEKNGNLPYGELSHGGLGIHESYQGILNDYKNQFNVSSDVEALSMLKVLAEDNYRGHLPCPCGSGDILRRCHGPALIELSKQQSKEYLFNEYFVFLTFLFPNPKEVPPGLKSKRLLQKIKKYVK